MSGNPPASLSHTPGPWRLTPYSSIVGRGVVAPRGIVVATVTGDGALPVAKANGALIAAAPDLLEALRALVECKDVKDRLDGWEAGSTQEMAAMAEWYDEHKPKAWEAARTAIRKAEGER